MQFQKPLFPNNKFLIWSQIQRKLQKQYSKGQPLIALLGKLRGSIPAQKYQFSLIGVIKKHTHLFTLHTEK